MTVRDEPDLFASSPVVLVLVVVVVRVGGVAEPLLLVSVLFVAVVVVVLVGIVDVPLLLVSLLLLTSAGVVLVGGVAVLLLLVSVGLVSGVVLVLEGGVVVVLVLVSLLLVSVGLVSGVVLVLEGGVVVVLVLVSLVLVADEPDEVLEGLVTVEPADLGVLLLAADVGFTSFAAGVFSVALVTDVFVDLVSVGLVLLSLFCASTVKAKNNIAIMMLKFFMALIFR